MIADGIEAMEGNGPLQGTKRDLGKIVLADDPIAADATCAHLMGLDPFRVQHLSDGGRFLGKALLKLFHSCAKSLHHLGYAAAAKKQENDDSHHDPLDRALEHG